MTHLGVQLILRVSSSCCYRHLKDLPLDHGNRGRVAASYRGGVEVALAFLKNSLLQQNLLYDICYTSLAKSNSVILNWKTT